MLKYSFNMFSTCFKTFTSNVVEYDNVYDFNNVVELVDFPDCNYLD